MKSIFRWNGQPIGFLRDGFLYNPDGQYLGWIGADGNVWGKDGRFIGEIVMDDYIMKNVLQKSPAPVLPRYPPLPVFARMVTRPRAPQQPMLNWVDPFAR